MIAVKCQMSCLGRKAEGSIKNGIKSKTGYMKTGGPIRAPYTMAVVCNKPIYLLLLRNPQGPTGQDALEVYQ